MQTDLTRLRWHMPLPRRGRKTNAFCMYEPLAGPSLLQMIHEGGVVHVMMTLAPCVKNVNFADTRWFRDVASCSHGSLSPTSVFSLSFLHTRTHTHTYTCTHALLLHLKHFRRETHLNGWPSRACWRGSSCRKGRENVIADHIQHAARLYVIFHVVDPCVCVAESGSSLFSLCRCVSVLHQSLDGITLVDICAFPPVYRPVILALGFLCWLGPLAPVLIIFVFVFLCVCARSFLCLSLFVFLPCMLLSAPPSPVLTLALFGLSSVFG